MENTDLGICWAMGKARGLRTKLPKKQMPGEDLHFFAYLPEEGRVYPLDPEEGFPKMDSLMSAVFCSREGKPGLIIK